MNWNANQTYGPRVFALLAVVTCVALSGCAGEELEAPTLLPISAQTVEVNQTLTLDLRVDNPQGASLTYSVEAPDLPGLDAVSELAGTPSGGTYRWTPLASHVGQHEFVFVVSSTFGDSRQSVVLTVSASSDAGPIFLRPGAGGTYDLSNDPCVRFDVEVRDDDSSQVAIRTAEPPPAGAVLSSTGNKRSRFEWCPTNDQIEAAERWTILLEADDFDHEPTQHGYVVVLRSPPKEDCPGEPPVITILSPDKGALVRSSSGYPVTISVSDDQGLRDSPLLLYSTVEPDDPNKPDLAQFEQVEFEAQGENWVGRIPSLGLEAEQEVVVYVVVTATDNDDAEGTTCDHVVDSELFPFVAVGGDGPTADLAECDECDQSADCATGICATSARGSRCLEPCAEGSCARGTCGPVTDTAGASAQACGDVIAVCEAVEACTDDAREDDDDIASATAFTGPSMDGTICPDDRDFFSFSAAANSEISVRLHNFSHDEGDLDLALYRADAQNLGVSDSETDEELIQLTNSTARTLYARVVGFDRAANDYTLSISSEAIATCEDDDQEPNDTADAASDFDESGTHSGFICSRNDDYLAFLVEETSDVSISMDFEWADYDLELELLDEEDAVIGFSRTGTGIETIEKELGEGIYTLRVYGFVGASGAYEITLDITPSASCSTDRDCPLETMCRESSCLSNLCGPTNPCPETHLCPWLDNDLDVAECGVTCETNGDCRDGEACKWFEEGRACGATGSGLNGDACSTYADCGGQRSCIFYVNGYCARMGCESHDDCESDTRCIETGGVGICLKDCLMSDNLCRLDEGYTCEHTVDGEDRSQWVCMQTSI